MVFFYSVILGEKKTPTTRLFFPIITYNKSLYRPWWLNWDGGAHTQLPLRSLHYIVAVSNKGFYNRVTTLVFGPWVIHNNSMVPSMLTFRRTPSRFTTTKVYSISVFLFPWRPKLLVKPNFGSFWKFLQWQKSGFTSTFFRVFHFHAHLFFTGTFSIFFTV